MSERAKHTPGPWDAHLDAPEPFEGLVGGVMITAPGDKFVAVALDGPEGTEEETIANARRISAALEMAEALRTSALVIHASHGHLFADCPDVVCAANRAALAKAGVTP